MTRKAARAASQRATPKVQRWTDLIASLLRHRFPVAFEEIAREVPGYDARGKEPASVKRTFERDKKELLRFGVPIETRLDEDGEPTLYTIARGSFYLPYLSLVLPDGRRTAPRHAMADSFGYRALKTLAFEPDELALVADAGARVRSLGDALLAAESESAMRKLAFDLPVGATAPVDEPHVVMPRAQPQAAVFAALGDALRDRKRVAFDYHAMGSDAVSKRTVEPYGLFFVNGHWYLAGRDQERGTLRNFRLSRMSDVERNPAKESTPDYDIPAGFRLKEHARSRQAWELGDGDAVEAVVEFLRDTGAVAAAAKLGSAVDGHPRRRCFAVRRHDSFARWLLSFGGDARPVSPEALVEEYRAMARRTRELYAADAAEGDA